MKKRAFLAPMAVSLSALLPAAGANATPANEAADNQRTLEPAPVETRSIASGDLVLSATAPGMTQLAYHVSHYSHSSHASHQSHYSGG
jgi:hypothetical protein